MNETETIRELAYFMSRVLSSGDVERLVDRVSHGTRLIRSQLGTGGAMLGRFCDEMEIAVNRKGN